MPNNTQINDISGNNTAQVVTWTLSDADATGDVMEWVNFADRCVQVVGTFSGGTVILEGSNDGTNWSALSDPQGNPLSFTSPKIEQVLEVTRYTRPRISSGTGVSVQVVAMLRRNNRV